MGKKIFLFALILLFLTFLLSSQFLENQKLSGKDILKQNQKLTSFAAEGALLASMRAQDKITLSYTQVHAKMLSEKVGRVQTEIATKDIDESLIEDVKSLGDLQFRLLLNFKLLEQIAEDKKKVEEIKNSFEKIKQEAKKDG